MESRYGRRWNREELIIAFNYYCQTPFGQLHKSNPEIVRLAGLLHRTPDALAMKLVNFASLDPVHRARGVKGLEHGSSMEEEVWREFHGNWSALAMESQAARVKLDEGTGSHFEDYSEPDGVAAETEDMALRKVRLVQGFFRKAVLVAYGESCAICSIALPEIIIASHIIPWRVDEKRRADPTNGLALCAFHDKVFDRGLMSFDKSLKVMLSARVKTPSSSSLHRVGLLDAEGQPLSLPERFAPDETAIQYHRDNVFQP